MSPRGLRRFKTSPSGARVLATLEREIGFSLGRFLDDDDEEVIFVEEGVEDLRFGGGFVVLLR